MNIVPGKKVIFFLLFFLDIGLIALYIQNTVSPPQKLSLVKTEGVNQSDSGAKYPVNTLTFDPVQNAVLTIYQSCDGKPQRCYVDAIQEKLLSFFTIPEIFTSIDDFDYGIGCHAFTHFLGRAMYQNIKSTADAHAACEFTCFGGCYHGVLEAYLGENGWDDADMLAGKKVVALCENSKGVNSAKPKEQVYGECLHGFGHGFMFVTENDLPRSLFLCDRLPKKREREVCYGGALMENASSSTNPDHPSKWTNKENPFYPCTILEEKYLEQCYWYQVGYILQKTRQNYSYAFEQCRTVPPAYQKFCILGIGTNTSSGFLKDPRKAWDVCAQGIGSERKQCVNGVIISFMGRYGGDAQEKILTLCEAVAPDIQKSCYEQFIEHALGWNYSSEYLRNVCENLSHDMRSACMHKIELFSI